MQTLQRLTNGIYGSYFPPRISACRLQNFISITLQVSPWEVATTGYLGAWMQMAIKGGGGGGGEVQLTSQIQCR